MSKKKQKEAEAAQASHCCQALAQVHIQPSTDVQAGKERIHLSTPVWQPSERSRDAHTNHTSYISYR